MSPAARMYGVYTSGMATKSVPIRWPEELLARVDAAAREADASRSEWVFGAVRLALVDPAPLHGEIAETHQARHLAHVAVRRATSNGTLSPPGDHSCADCSGPAVLYHHESYDEADWLVVVPLCVMCHCERHRVAPRPALPSLTFRLPSDLLEQIDAAAGAGKRSEWLIRAFREALAPVPAIERPQLRKGAVAGRGPLPTLAPHPAPRPDEVSPRFRDPKAGRL